MKNTMICILALLASTNLFAQKLVFNEDDKRYAYGEVLNFEGKKELDLFNAVKEWASSNIGNFNRKNNEKSDVLFVKSDMAVVAAAYKNNEPLKLSEKENGKFIISVVAKYNGSQMGMIRTMFVNYDFKILVKDGKIKFEASNFSYTHYNNATGKPMQLSGFKDSGDCASKGTFESLKECKIATKAFENMITWFDEDITEVKAGLAKFVGSSKMKEIFDDKTFFIKNF